MIAAHAPSRAVPFWLWPWCAFLFLVPFKQLIPGAPFIALEVFAAALLAFAPRRGASLAHGRFLAVTMLFLMLAMSYFFSLYPEESKMPLLRIGMAYLTYVLAASAALTPGELRLALQAWFAGGACAALALLKFGSAGMSGRASMAVGDYAAEPNFFIAELVLPFAIGCWLLVKPTDGPAPVLTRWGMRAMTAGGLGLMLGATLFTQSRGGLISLLAVGVAYLVIARRWRTLLLTAALGISLYAAVAPSLGRYDVTADPTGSQRTVIWEVVLPEAVAHWPTGIGLNATRFHTTTLPGLYEEKSAHNTYVQAFVETGLFGLLALLAVVGSHLRLGGTSPWVAPMRAGLVGLFVAAVFLHMLAIQALWIPWIVAAQVAASRLPRAEPGRLPRQAPAALPTLPTASPEGRAS
jgi:O-antigen ligase